MSQETERKTTPDREVNTEGWGRDRCLDSCKEMVHREENGHRSYRKRDGVVVNLCEFRDCFSRWKSE